MLAQSQDFDAEVMQKVCNDYLEQAEGMSTEDVFYLVRFALSGNPVGAPMIDIAEVVGKEQVLSRLKLAMKVFE